MGKKNFKPSFKSPNGENGASSDRASDRRAHWHSFTPAFPLLAAVAAPRCGCVCFGLPRRRPVGRRRGPGIATPSPSPQALIGAAAPKCRDPAPFFFRLRWSCPLGPTDARPDLAIMLAPARSPIHTLRIECVLLCKCPGGVRGLMNAISRRTMMLYSAVFVKGWCCSIHHFFRPGLWLWRGLGYKNNEKEVMSAGKVGLKVLIRGS